MSKYVDAGAFREDQLAAQIAGIEHTGQSDKAKNGGGDTISWTSKKPQDEGDEVENRRTRVNSA